MIKTTTIIISLIIIAAGIYFFIPTGQNNEVPASFGTWKLELSGIDSEGNTIPLELKTNNAASVLSFTYEDQEIDYIHYQLKAKATGTGYNSCEIDLSDVTSDGIIFQGAGGPGSYSYIFDDITGSSTSNTNIDLDNNFHGIFSRSYPLDRADDAPAGDYTGEFRFTGTVQYRGIGDSNGAWESEDITFKAFVELQSDGGSSSDDDPDPPGGGSDPSEYPITVMSNVPYNYASCSYDPGDITREMLDDFPSVFWRGPGTYVVRAYWSGGKSRSTSVTVTSGAKIVKLNYPSLSVVSNYYLVDASNTVSDYGTGSYTLGS